MTKFKVTRLRDFGDTDVMVYLATDWADLVNRHLYLHTGAIIKIEVIGSDLRAPEELDDQ